MVYQVCACNVEYECSPQESTWAKMAQKTTNESNGNHHHDKAFKCIYYGERIS